MTSPTSTAAPTVPAVLIKSWLIAAFFLAAAVLYSVGISRCGFEGNDERRYAMVAKQIWLGEGAFVMHYLGDLYPDKPPLFFWAQALCYEALGGVSPLAARLPLFVTALGGLAFAFLMMRQMDNSRVALIGTALLALSFRYFWSGRWARLDTPMCAFVFASFWASARLIFPKPDQDDSPAARWRWAMFAWGSMALAGLAKGPGFIPWLGTLAIFSWRRPGLGVLRRHHAIAGLGLMLAIFGAWFVPAAALGGRDYIGPMIGTHVVERTIGVVRHEQPIWYFVLKIIPDGFPISILLPAALIAAFRRPKGEPMRDQTLFAVIWFLFTLVFFSLPAGKRGQYILPLYPAMAYLAAGLIDRGLLGESSGARRVLRRHLWPALAVFALAPILAGLVALGWRTLGQESPIMHPLDKLKDDFQNTPPAAVIAFVLAWLFGCGAVGMIQLARSRVGRAAFCAGGAIYGLYVSMFVFFLPLNRSDALPRRIAEELADGGVTLDDVAWFGDDTRYTLYGDGRVSPLRDRQEALDALTRTQGPRYAMGEEEKIRKMGDLPARLNWRRVARWASPDGESDEDLVLYAHPREADRFSQARGFSPDSDSIDRDIITDITTPPEDATDGV